MAKGTIHIECRDQAVYVTVVDELTAAKVKLIDQLNMEDGDRESVQATINGGEAKLSWTAIRVNPPHKKDGGSETVAENDTLQVSAHWGEE